MFVLLMIVLILELIGCATSNLTIEQQAIKDKAMKTPLVLRIPVSEEADAWERAKQFVSKFASAPITMMNENIITCDAKGVFSKETYTIEKGYNVEVHIDKGIGYHITKFKTNDYVEIEVKCIGYAQVMMKSSNAVLNENAHYCAYYIQTGELDSTLVNK